jgi:phospholipid/cholesterol/gamma-HCH transport system ATP-binding protein
MARVVGIAGATVLGDGKVQGVGSMSELAQMDNAAVRIFFDGPRGRAAQEQERHQADANVSGKIGVPAWKPK